MKRIETNRIDREQKAEYNNTRIHFCTHRIETLLPPKNLSQFHLNKFSVFFFSFEKCVKYTTIELIRIVFFFIFMLFDSEVFRFRNTRSRSHTRFKSDEKCSIWHWMAQGTFLFYLNNTHSNAHSKENLSFYDLPFSILFILSIWIWFDSVDFHHIPWNKHITSILIKEMLKKKKKRDFTVLWIVAMPCPMRNTLLSLRHKQYARCHVVIGFKWEWEIRNIRRGDFKRFCFVFQLTRFIYEIIFQFTVQQYDFSSDLCSAYIS